MRTRRSHRFIWVWAVVALMGCAVPMSRAEQAAQTAQTSGRHPVAVSSARLGAYFEQAEALPSVGERAAFWSQKLYSDARLLAPLGRGPDVSDSAPVLPAHFDCTTFVETVGGLSRSTGALELADRIIALRYKQSEVSYGTRNHFPELDWIPNNEASGLLTDVTLRLARDSGLVASFAHKDIDKIAWLRLQGTQGRAVASEADDDALPVAVSVPYVPLRQVAAVADSIPQGAVVNVVHSDSPEHPVLIGHQMIFVREGREGYLIHASRGRPIVKTRLADYVRRLKHEDWPVLGLNFNAF